MTVQELIHFLSKYPMGMDVCRMDVMDEDEETGGARNLSEDNIEEMTLLRVATGKEEKCICFLFND